MAWGSVPLSSVLFKHSHSSFILGFLTTESYKKIYREAKANPNILSRVK